MDEDEMMRADGLPGRAPLIEAIGINTRKQQYLLTSYAASSAIDLCFVENARNGGMISASIRRDNHRLLTYHANQHPTAPST